MLIQNPNRFLGQPLSTATPTPGGIPVPQQQLLAMLQSAQERITVLERQVATLLGAIYVDDNGNVEIGSTGKVSLIAGSDIVLRADIAVKAQSVGGASLDLVGASATVRGPGMVSLEAAIAKCSGTVQCDTIIANSVVGSSYTPGAGNVW